MERASHQYSAARVVLHDALPSVQISWRVITATASSLLRLLGRIVIEGALQASYAVAQAAATVAPQPQLLVLPDDAAHVVGELAPGLRAIEPLVAQGEQRAPAGVAQHARGEFELAPGLLGVRQAYARLTQRR